MSRRILISALLALALTPAAAAAAPPEPVTLGAGWQFHPDPADKGLAAGWVSGAPAQGWEPVSVPHTFDARPLEHLFSGTVAWYRLRFRPPAAPVGYAWALRFQQVRRQSVVWLNGRRIGSHDDPYTPFELEARGLRKGMNELVLRVDSRKGTRPREGWWNWGGILRPVTLVPRGGIALHDLGLLPRVTCDAACHASVQVTGAVRNRTGFALSGSVGVRLTAPDGRTSEGQLQVKDLRGTDTRVISGRIPVRGAALWSPATPQLYDARVVLRSGNREEQTEDLRIGLRSIEVKDGKLALNGKPIPLYGASIQEDFPGRGAALTPEENAEIVAELKQLGANVTRAHYPLNEDLLRRLDEAGIMVWNQAPIYHRNAELNRPEGLNSALDTVRGTIIATRNHPSVIVHSVANEPVAAADTRRGTREFLTKAAALARRLDPSRPVAVDILSYPRVPYQKSYAQFDALGINNYFGWYVGKPSHPTGNFNDLEPYIQKIHRRYPKQAMVMTEFGAESTIDGPADEKGTYAFQSDFINRVMDVVERNDFMGGSVYWTLREFAVKPRWSGGSPPTAEPRPDSIHNKALIKYDGELKPAFEVLKQRIASALAPPAPVEQPAPDTPPAPETSPEAPPADGR